MASFYKIFSFILAVAILVSPTAAFAQYGGGTTINLSGTGTGTTSSDNNNSSAPKFSANNTGDSVNINIESAKKGSVLDVKIGNSNSGVFKIKFTVNADVTNAKIAINKIDSSQLFPGFPGGFVTAYALAVTNINYDQITNFSFSFKIKKNLVESKNLLGYSSNSPWALAGLSTETDSSIASDEAGFVASAPVAFRQFGVSAATTTQMNMANANSTSTLTVDKTNSVDLVRTGGNSAEIISVLVGLITLIGFSFALIKTNQNSNRN